MTFCCTIYYPVSYMRYRESFVITDVLAARLFSVTVKIFLFVSPRRLSSCPKYQDTEDKQDGQPHLWSQNQQTSHTKRYTTLRNNNNYREFYFSNGVLISHYSSHLQMYLMLLQYSEITKVEMTRFNLQYSQIKITEIEKKYFITLLTNLLR